MGNEIESFLKQLKKDASEEQFNVIKNINIDINNEERLLCLTGFAGSGKTWTTAQLVKLLLLQNYTIALTAPTHKAVKVSKEMLMENGVFNDEINLNTIHSFLNLKPDRGYSENKDVDINNIKTKFVKSYKEELANLSVDLLIIEESSMISESMYKLIINELETTSRISYILFIGDEYQLLPVDEDDEDRDNNRKDKIVNIFQKEEIKKYRLNTIVRQAKDNPIIKKSQELINILKTRNFPNDYKTIFNDLNDDKSSNITIYHSEQFLTDYLNESEEDTIIAAFTNKKVIEYNNYVRYMKIKENSQICEKDKIIFQKAYNGKNSSKYPETVFQNGDLISLVKVEIFYNSKYKLYEWKCISESGKCFYLINNSEESLNRYKEVLIELADKAKAAPKGKNKKLAWDEYFDFKESYANIKFSYAMTIYKLQGSTYNNIYVDLFNLEWFYNKNPENIIRLIYVAITRASQNVKILI